MDDRPAEPRGLGVFIVVVQRVGVAGERGEGEDIRLGDCSRRARENLALAEIFEIELRGLVRHCTLPFLQAPALALARNTLTRGRFGYASLDRDDVLSLSPRGRHETAAQRRRENQDAAAQGGSAKAPQRTGGAPS